MAFWGSSSVVEQHAYTVNVTGSNPVTPTKAVVVKWQTQGT